MGVSALSIAAYIIGVNSLTFLIYGLDKWKATHHKWRISEATLLALAAIGGSIGAWLGMRVWRHKTLHKKFRYGVPLIFAAQVLAIIAYFCMR